MTPEQVLHWIRIYTERSVEGWAMETGLHKATLYRIESGERDHRPHLPEISATLDKSEGQLATLIDDCREMDSENAKIKIINWLKGLL